MIEDSVRVRIDKALDGLKPFFEFGLSTLENQIEDDKKYIVAICELRDLDYRPYVEYYEQGVEDMR